MGLFLAVGLAAGRAGAADTQSVLAQLRALPWKPAHDIGLPVSHSKIVSIPDYVAVTGADAVTARRLEDGHEPQGTEAEVIGRDNGEAIFQYVDSGYVKVDDWSQLKPDELIAQISKNTERANAERRKAGRPELHVTGWIQEPTLNTDMNLAYWVFGLDVSDGSRIFNAVALKLGRRGYERIVYIGDESAVGVADQRLLLVASNQRFDQGYRYSDYVPATDRAAEYGIAGLVAGVMGVKLLQVGAAGGLLLLLKKFIWIIIFPFVFLYRRLFWKKSGGA